MSKTPDATNALNLASEEAPVEKTAFIRKPLNFIKKHPKIATAGFLGFVLIGVAASTGNKVVDSDEPPHDADEEDLWREKVLDVPVPEDVN